MATYTKQEARRIIEARLLDIPDSEYEALSAAAYKNTRDWLQAMPALKTILLYEAQPKWREVAVSALGGELRGISFDFLPPNKGTAFPLQKYDAVLVPLYGHSKNGYRLGHGGGWYDRYFAQSLPALKVGIGLEMGSIAFAIDPFDIPMDVLITESSVTVLS